MRVVELVLYNLQHLLLDFLVELVEVDHQIVIVVEQQVLLIQVAVVAVVLIIVEILEAVVLVVQELLSFVTNFNSYE
jgi:hypothetical protein